jgi:glycerol-3-phosphate acyltransferase PlsY
MYCVSRRDVLKTHYITEGIEDMEYFWIILVGAYFLGSIPIGLLAAKLLVGVDPRTCGSGNIGAANVYRSSGWQAGALTLAGDILKGALPVLAAKMVWPGPGSMAELVWSLMGLAAVAGHLWPVYLGFKGGKGVATAFGAVAVLSPVAALLTLTVYAAVLWRFRIFSLGSLAGAWFLPMAMGLGSSSKIFLCLAGILSLMIVVKHRSNIRRLALGEEAVLSSPQAADGDVGSCKKAM